jgi:glycosyltransferase involved in cell wall biosynthesis
MAVYGFISMIIYKRKNLCVEHANYCHYSGIFARLRDFVYNIAGCLICITKEDCEDFINNGIPAVHINNPKSFISDKKSQLSNQKLIAAGRLSPEKGFDTLIEAFKILLNSCTAKEMEVISCWELEIYGEGYLRSKLKKQINDNGLENKIYLKGYTRNLKDMYINSSIFVLSSRYEGFGLVLIEAMECGLPIISFDCKVGPNEILSNGKFGILVKDQNINELALSMKKLILSEEKRLYYQKLSIKRALDFDVEKVIAEWECIFSDNFKL